MGEKAILEAVGCFDRALLIRSNLPFDKGPFLAYGLAACWLNRAEALIRLADPERILEAIRACDEGIALLVDLPFATDARFPRRLALAHQNRGLALQLAEGPGSEEASDSFRKAIEVLESDAALPIDDREFLLATVHANLANTLADQKDGDAEAIAQLALQLVKETEKRDANAAEAGLKSRHVLCRVLANRLDSLERVHDATDAVDDGLELARHWEKKGVSHFRGIAYDLFRFGSRVYSRYQPQFLQEFIRENLDPMRSSLAYVDSEEMRAAAAEALCLPKT